MTRVSAGNPEYGKGTSVSLRAVSGHRDTYNTSCPGNSVYAQLPSITRQIASTGLPKIYSPIVIGGVGGTVRFTARLSSAVPWTGHRRRLAQQDRRDGDRDKYQHRLDVGRHPGRARCLQVHDRGRRPGYRGGSAGDGHDRNNVSDRGRVTATGGSLRRQPERGWGWGHGADSLLPECVFPDHPYALGRGGTSAVDAVQRHRRPGRAVVCLEADRFP